MKVITSDFEWMPVPFVANTTTPYIVHPDQNGHYHFKHNTVLKLSCVGTYFKSPHRLSSLISEITVKCLDGFLRYNNRAYVLDKFKCNKTPRSRLIVTNETCYGSEENKIVKVGFHSTSGFMPVYKICFNYIKKNVLFTWMYMKSPFYKFRQVSDKYSRFIRTSNYGPTTITMSYSNQVS